MNNFIISTTSSLDGIRVKSYLDVVNYNIVIGTNIFSDFAASFTDFFGGSSGTYQNKMNMMYENAKAELAKITKRMGGNAILGFRIDFEEISGKGKSMFMLTSSGTACLLDIPNEKEQLKAERKIISKDLLDSEVTKQKILKHLTSDNGSVSGLSEKDWNVLFETPSNEIIEILVDKYYTKVQDTNKTKIETLVKSLDYDVACKMVYPLYSENRIVKDTMIQQTIDYSLQYEKIIRVCDLFNPSMLLELMDKNIDKALTILDCEKPFYNGDDLKLMESICEKLDSCPNVGEIITGKMGMFTKEKKLFVCRNGHKNEKEVEYCGTCGENIKGLSRDQVNLISNFKEKVKVLKNIFLKTL